MNEKLPLLQKAIEQLKEKEENHLADELTTLVEELSAQLQKKELTAIQTTEEKITQFLAEHEAEITIGDWQAELATLKGTVSSPSTKKQSSGRSRFRGDDEEEVSTEPEATEEEEGSRRERPRAKALGISLLVGGAIYAYTSYAQKTPEGKPPESIASGIDYEQASLEKRRLLCYEYLQQIGFSKILAAGIVGNIQQESGFKTDALGDGDTSYGLCQRHDTGKNKGRRTNLKTFCASPAGKGRPINDYTLQLDFIKYELEGPEQEAYSLLKKATSYEEATTIFVTEYERAGSPHLENRLAYAGEVFGQDNTNLA